MNCPHCGGTLNTGITSYSVNRNGYHLIIDHGPVSIVRRGLLAHEILDLMRRDLPFG